MPSLQDSFQVATSLEKAWDLFSRFEDLAHLIPTVQELEVDGDELHGRVGVKLGRLPITSRLTLRVIEQRERSCLKVEGISYLGETLRDQIQKGKAKTFDRGEVGRLFLHLDLRATDDPRRIEIRYEAQVEAKGRLKRIYESIIKMKAPGLMREFAANIKEALESDEVAGEPAQGRPETSSGRVSLPGWVRSLGHWLRRVVLGVFRRKR